MAQYVGDLKFVYSPFWLETDVSFNQWKAA